MTTIDALTSGTEREVTDEQILALSREAAEAGDEDQVKICERALRGNVSARAKCACVIADAEAQS